VGRRRATWRRHVGAQHETREQITDRHRRVWEYSDATINALALGSRGLVPWWPRPDVKPFNILAHRLTEPNTRSAKATADVRIDHVG
jgi:hypothetical protein